MIIIAEVSELTRKIKLPTDRALSVNGDYQVDGIAFKLPATYEGDFDFSTAAARVHWTGVDKVEHTNLITEEDGNGYPLWVMPSELTQGGHGVIEFAVSFVATDETAAVTKRWISDPVSFRNRRTVNGSNEDEEAEEETTYDRLASAIADVRAAQAEVEDTNAVLSSLTGSAPVPVENKSDMVDDGHLYLYTGDETGLVTGNLYYYVNGTLTNGGKYGSMEVDATLTQSGQAADAKKTGDEISAIKEDLSATLYTHTNADISSAEVKSGLISSTSGNWVYNANYKSYFIPIPKNAKSISVTANDANVTVLAILINKALVSYTNPYYADGCSRETVDVGSTREFSVPSNGNWICILKSTTSGSTVTDFTPVSVDFTLVEIDTRNLSNITHEPITSQGVLNVVRRCRQLTDIKWTPAVDIPRICQLRGYSSVNPQYYEDVFKAGIEYKGIPYGQATKNTGKWGKDSVIGFKVGWGVGLDTFISAVQSPESVIAKESKYMATTGKHLASFYATICTALCGYAYNLPTYYTTNTIGGADGMERLDIVRNLNNNGYRFSIGDMLLSGAHGSVITDIKRDSDGMPLAIEISEATTIGNDDWNVEGSQYGGICRRLFWSYDEFVGKWGSYGVYRYSMIDNVEYTPSPYVDTGNEGDTLRVFEFPVLPYMGENFQYMTGAIPTTKILTPAYRANSLNKLRVLKDGQAWNVDGTTSYYDVSGAFVEVGFADAGTYTAYLCQVVDGAETMTTRPCHWTVI